MMGCRKSRNASTNLIDQFILFLSGKVILDLLHLWLHDFWVLIVWFLDIYKISEILQSARGMYGRGCGGGYGKFQRGRDALFSRSLAMVTISYHVIGTN